MLVENHGAGDGFVRGQDTPSFHQCEPIHEADGSVPGRAPESIHADGAVSGDVRFVPPLPPPPPVAEIAEEVRVAGTSGGKQKRGRPARAQVKAPPKKRKDEEDVCFICFDGGNLVLCDRR